MKRTIFLLLSLLVVLGVGSIITGCASKSGDYTKRIVTQGDFMEESHQIRALSFNVWIYGTKVKGGFDLVADTIIDTSADIVTLVEVQDKPRTFVGDLVQELADRGVTYYGSLLESPADTAIISRWPIIEETLLYKDGKNCVVRSLIDKDGETIVDYGAHLYYKYYTTYLPRGYAGDGDLYPDWKLIDTNRDGQPDPVVDLGIIREDNRSSERYRAMEMVVQDMVQYKEKGFPIMIMGDFNEPPALDWTETTQDLFDHNGVVYSWDSTQVLMDAGFIDSYREVYPNPVTHPGFTWPVAAMGIDGKRKNTTWAPLADERDRIDFIFYQGERIQAVGTILVGPPLTVERNEFVDESLTLGDTFSLDKDAFWPSDHRGVLTIFETK